jgi:hypothetical protein
MIEEIRKEFAARAFGDIRHSLDSALSYALKLAYEHGICDGSSIDTYRMLYHLRELGKTADMAALVIAEIEPEDNDEAEKLQQIIDGIQKWGPDAILATAGKK